jgi:ATP-dependent DNA helicase PIF1
MLFHAGMLIKRARMIIWDEAPMANRLIFEAFDRCLRDLAVGYNRNIAFGGKLVVFGGDFRQVLPVVVHGADQVNACFTQSALWKYVRTHKLSVNMRIAGASEPLFGDWLLRIGDGIEPTRGDYVVMPDQLRYVTSANELLDAVYPGLATREFDQHTTEDIATYFHRRAILSAYNEVVDEINTLALMQFKSSDKMEYVSADTFIEDEKSNMPQVPTEYLNTISISGLPEHLLRVSVGCPVILLRNLNHPAGLCNGTRLIVTYLYKRVIVAQHATGTRRGDTVFIPRIDLVPENTESGFKFKRRQFPIRPAFAMTTNEAQAQTLDHVGIDLTRDVFAHGQL